MKVRARGPLILVLRLAGPVGVFACALSYLMGTAGLAWLLTAVAIGIAWQVWLLRPGIVVTSEAVTLRGLWADTTLTLESIQRFRVARERTALDQLARSVKLVVELRDGTEITCRWIGWQDLVSTWLVTGE
ncbi:MAG TPA: hypothetical protein VL068_11720 [Microthrixaceae bacterium]|nr:hypothetical protein [Microthrixaceae bacterium]